MSASTWLNTRTSTQPCVPGLSLAGGHATHEVEERDELLGAWRDAREATLAAFADLDDRDRVPWGGRRMGDPVNVEVDLLARYVARLSAADNAA